MSKQNNMRSLNWRQSGWRSVGWKNSDVTVEAPADSILHWDADIDAFSEQTGGPHTFNHNILSPQYQRNADGSYTDVGAKPAVDVFDGEKWLRSCGAITNLFSGDTSIARSVTLTEQAYTLQVFGAGAVACSYGTATVGNPLTFTATATESVEFTPDGATYWMLTATSYPVPYVPPGVTQPASNATPTNGCWFTLADGSPVWKALGGEPDGVELVTNGGFDTSVDGWSKNLNGVLAWDSGGKLSITRVSNPADLAFQAVGCVVGAKYRVSLKNDAGVGYASVFIGIVGNPAGGPYYQQPTRGAAEYWSFEFVATAATHTIGLAVTYVASGTRTFDNISVQRIQPSPMTLATRIRMGVGSGDIAANTALDGISCAASGGTVMRAQDISGAKYPASSNDGTTSALSPAITWSRNAVMRRFVQVNMAGTQFRVGYMIEGTHTTIQWGSLVAYDGSFGPSTLYKLLLNFNNPTPKWFNKITVWRKQVSDTELLGAWA